VLSYNWQLITALIWLNHRLITGKWPGYCRCPILSGGVKLNCLICAQHCSISLWHVVCVPTVWCTHHDVRGFSSSPPMTYQHRYSP